MSLRIVKALLTTAVIVTGAMAAGSAQATGSFFASIDDVDAFCATSYISCYQVTGSELGYYVEYEVLQDTNSGPRRGDGDGEVGGSGG